MSDENCITPVINNLEKAAVEYARQGLHIIPLQPREKRPLYNNWTQAPHLTADAATQHWKQHPDHNIGVLLGRPINENEVLVGVDFDVKDHDAAPMLRSKLAELLPNADQAPAVRSGSGGESRHLYYRAPKGTRSRVLWRAESGEIRLIARGGQLVLPPSVHPSGGAYEWLRPLPADLRELPELPAELVGNNSTDGVEVKLPETWERVDLDKLDIPESVKRRIVEGDNENADRSEVIHGVMLSLTEHGIPDELILRIMADPDHAVSEKPLEERRGNVESAMEWLARDLERVHAARRERWEEIWRKAAAPLTKEDWEAIAALRQRNEPLAQRIITPAAISSTEWEDGRLSPDVIVENLLFADLEILAAQGGAGKSTLTLYESIHVALGMDLYGHRVARAGHVVIVTAEDPRGIIVGRLKRLCLALKLSAEDMQRVRERVRIIDLSTAPRKLSMLRDGNIVLTGFADELSAALRPLQPSLVALDPLMSFNIGEQHGNDGMQSVVTAARRIIRALNCPVRLVHHVAQAAARDKIDDAYTMRGGTALADGSRMVANLIPVESAKLRDQLPEEWAERLGPDSDARLLRLSRPKLSYGPPQPPLLLLRDGFSLEWMPYPAPRDEATQALDEARVLRYIEEQLAAGEYLSKENLRTVGGEALGLSRTRVIGALERLQESGRLEYVPIPPEVETKGRKKNYFRPTK